MPRRPEAATTLPPPPDDEQESGVHRMPETVPPPVEFGTTDVDHLARSLDARMRQPGVSPEHRERLARRIARLRLYRQMAETNEQAAMIDKDTERSRRDLESVIGAPTEETAEPASGVRGKRTTKKKANLPPASAEATRESAELSAYLRRNQPSETEQFPESEALVAQQTQRLDEAMEEAEQLIDEVELLQPFLEDGMPLAETVKERIDERREKLRDLAEEIEDLWALQKSA